MSLNQPTTNSSCLQANLSGTFKMINITPSVYPDNDNGNCSGLSGPHNKYDTMYCEPIQSVPLALVSGLVATAIITGNLLVILAILRGSSRFHRPIYWLIIHLSCADLLVGIMLMWNYCLASLFDIHNTITSLMIIFSIWIASVSSSTIGFVFLAIDRYVQIFYKTFHRKYATRKTVGVAIFCAWFFPILVYSILPYFINWSCNETCVCKREKHMECTPHEECSQILPPFKKTYSLCISLILFTMMPIPFGIYGMIFFRVQKKTHAIKHRHKRQDMRLIKTLVVILAVFLFTLSPVGIMLLLDYSSTTRNKKIIDISLYVFVIAFLNSLANPLLYMWRMAAIRRSVQRLLCCCWKKTNGHSKKDITSYQSDQRSPTARRHSNDQEEEQKFIGQNNNVPFPAVLCLRQIKRGKYSNSRTSTPLSERSNNRQEHSEEMVNFTKPNIEEPALMPVIFADKNNCNHNCTSHFDLEITEL